MLFESTMSILMTRCAVHAIRIKLRSFPIMPKSSSSKKGGCLASNDAPPKRMVAMR